MAKFLIQSTQRAGFDGSWRAGRKWPSGAPIEVDVVDGQENDPEPKPGDPTIAIGTKTFDTLKADPLLRILPAGDPLAASRALQDIDQVRTQLEAALNENARLRAQIEQGKPQQGQQPHAAPSGLQGQQPPTPAPGSAEGHPSTGGASGDESSAGRRKKGE